MTVFIGLLHASADSASHASTEVPAAASASSSSLKSGRRIILGLMRIIIAGGRGFLGSALTGQLTTEGHDVVVLTRPPAGGSSRHAAPPVRVTYAPWNPDGQSGGWAQALHAADAVVNLAGESIAGKRWTAAQKEQIRTSRLMATGSLVAAIREMATPPRVFVRASARSGNRLPPPRHP
jgi:nucleoside-diphosphate-sugar epimerase